MVRAPEVRSRPAAEGCANGGRVLAQVTVQSLTPVIDRVVITAEAMSEEERWHYFDMRMDAIDAHWVEEFASEADDAKWFGITADSEESFEKYQICAGG